MIPKFLVCNNHLSPDFEFVLHTEFPRFLAQTYDEDDGSVRITPVIWFDQPKGMDEMDLARLMREMGDWFAEEMGGSY